MLSKRYQLSDADEQPPGRAGITSHNQLVRSLGLLDILMVGVAAMIGGSIFVLTGPAIGLAGSAVIVAFIINAIITLFTAMAYAELPNWKMNFSNFAPMGISGVVAAMGLTFIAFEGYEVIVQTGEEVKNPRRNIPRAIFISLGAVVILYCLIAFVSIGAIFPAGIEPWKYIGQSGELGIMKAAELLVPYGAFIVLGGGMISTSAHFLRPG